MTTREVARRCGVTLRMVQWWDEARVITCGWDGRSARIFDEDQMLSVALVAELRRKGLRLQQIRRLKLGPIRGEYLVTSGDHVLWCDRERLIPCVAEAPGGCCVVSVEDLRAQLNGDSGSRPRRRKRADLWHTPGRGAKGAKKT